jgi:hypothetical protein
MRFNIQTRHIILNILMIKPQFAAGLSMRRGEPCDHPDIKRYQVMVNTRFTATDDYYTGVG